MLQGLDETDRLEIFKLATTPEKRAEIVSYLDDEIQEALILKLEPKEARHVVSLMESDDAADLLERLPQEISKDILGSMVKEDSDDVTDLMGYPKDTAGGLMSADFFAMPQNATVGDAIREIQEQSDALIAFYLYLVNEHYHLIGVLSLRQLVLAKPTDLLNDLMSSDVISVTLDTPQEEVAKMVERYDFLSVPVVDNSNELVGVITVDDVIDVIREEAKEEILALGQVVTVKDPTLRGQFIARIPWLLLSYMGGIICFAIIYSFMIDVSGELMPIKWMTIGAILPLILAMGGTAGNQAASVALGEVRGESHLDWEDIGHHLRIELLLSLCIAAVCSLITILIGLLFSGLKTMNLILGGVLGIQVIASMLLGASIPLLMKKWERDPSVNSLPFLMLLVEILGVTFLFGSGYFL